ncbi:MAG: TldD/PmbA family protein [Lachnospiraceae bacterium]|nr:TldD/PmbA family protein [Lachnospiraceae bacterium]
MKVKESSYIRANKPLFKKLVSELLKSYEYASVLVNDSFGMRYSVSKTGANVGEDDLYTAKGFVVKVYEGGCYAEYSGNEISEEEIGRILEFIKDELVTMGGSREKSQYPLPTDEAANFSKSTDYDIDPVEMGDEAIIAKLTDVHKRGMAYDERILNCGVMCAFQKYSKLFLSKNKDLEQNVMWSSGAIFVNSKRGDEVKEYYTSASNLGGMEILDTIFAKVEKAAGVAIELLDSEPLKPGEYECVCDPQTTGMIVHEAFGHGVEMDMFVKDRALAKKFMGEYVASPLVTMHDGNAVDQTATYFFDDEGTVSSDTVIIDKGVLVSGISDLQSAMALGTKPTGNGRRESYKRKTYTRMTNTYFEPGTDKVEDMIASVKDGLLLENPESGMEDPKNWGIQCMVNIGREIKDGKLTGRIFSPIVLTGYVPDLLKSISMMSDVKELDGAGMCGKGYKEWVKVSDGGPYIKARIRLG